MALQTKNDGWYVISLRPQGEHAALRRAAGHLGARLIALSPWRIRTRTDDATRASLAKALSADMVLFTSPAAVASAAELAPLRAADGQTWLAVGGGTASALQRHGIEGVLHPQRMDSEGLLALPALAQVDGRSIGFVSAPDGRNLLAPTLAARGARLLRADVYAREDVPLRTHALDAWQPPASAFVLISSGGALDRVMDRLAYDARTRLLGATAVVASDRLARQASAAGFARVLQAEGPRDAQLLRTAADAASQGDPLA